MNGYDFAYYHAHLEHLTNYGAGEQWYDPGRIVDRFAFTRCSGNRWWVAEGSHWHKNGICHTLTYCSESCGPKTGPNS